MSKTRIGILGAGWWAVENHIPILKSLQDVEVVGICRLGREELLKVQERFDIPFATEDYKELLDLQGLEGVVVSSPHHLHFEHASAALERGLHVLCEKPMVLHGAQANELVRLAELKSLHFLIPYGWNYTEIAALARRALGEGVIGEIEQVQLLMGSALRDLLSGVGAWFAKESFFSPQLQTWSDPSIGGGYAHGQLTHGLALLFWIADLDPVEVFAMVGKTNRGADLYDAICCSFRNGAIGVLGGAGTIPPGSPKQMDLRIFGRYGVLLLDIERPRLELQHADGRKVVYRVEHLPGQYDCVKPVRVFVDLLKGKPAENRSSERLGARVVSFIEAVFQSVSTRTITRV